jgi:hypothetical protein
MSDMNYCPERVELQRCAQISKFLLRWPLYRRTSVGLVAHFGTAGVEKERIRKVLAIIKDVSVEISEQTGIECMQ